MMICFELISDLYKLQVTLSSEISLSPQCLLQNEMRWESPNNLVAPLSFSSTLVFLSRVFYSSQSMDMTVFSIFLQLHILCYLFIVSILPSLILITVCLAWKRIPSWSICVFLSISLISVRSPPLLCKLKIRYCTEPNTLQFSYNLNILLLQQMNIYNACLMQFFVLFVKVFLATTSYFRPHWN